MTGLLDIQATCGSELASLLINAMDGDACPANQTEVDWVFSILRAFQLMSTSGNREPQVVEVSKVGHAAIKWARKQVQSFCSYKSRRLCGHL